MTHMRFEDLCVELWGDEATWGHWCTLVRRLPEIERRFNRKMDVVFAQDDICVGPFESIEEAKEGLAFVRDMLGIPEKKPNRAGYMDKSNIRWMWLDPCDDAFMSREFNVMFRDDVPMEFVVNVVTLCKARIGEYGDVTMDVFDNYDMTKSWMSVHVSSECYPLVDSLLEELKAYCGAELGKAVVIEDSSMDCDTNKQAFEGWYLIPRSLNREEWEKSRQ